MRITGILMKIEPYSGTFDDRDDPTKKIPYSGARLLVFDGDELCRIKIPKSLIDSHGYGVGEAVDLRVQVEAVQGARNAYLTTTLVGSFEPKGTGTESLAPKPPRSISAVS